MRSADQVNAAQIEHEIVLLVAEARREGWYEDDPAWSEIDDRLSLEGYDLRRTPEGVGPFDTPQAERWGASAAPHPIPQKPREFACIRSMRQISHAQSGVGHAHRHRLSGNA